MYICVYINIYIYIYSIIIIIIIQILYFVKEGQIKFFRRMPIYPPASKTKYKTINKYNIMK